MPTHLGRRNWRFYRVQLLDEHTHEGCECLRERYQKQPCIIVEYIRGLARDSAQETWPMTNKARVAIHGLWGAKMGYIPRVGLQRARVDTSVSIKALPAQDVEADEVSRREPDPHSLPEVSP